MSLMKQSNADLGFCGDVITDCRHGVHPVAVDTLLLLDWPVLTDGRERKCITQNNTLNTYRNPITRTVSDLLV